MTQPSRDRSNPITTLVLEEADGGIGLKIPEFDIEIYGEDLPELLELAEEQLWWRLERGGEAIPERATLAIKRVTKEEFGPTCFEREAEEEDWGDEDSTGFSYLRTQGVDDLA